MVTSVWTYWRDHSLESSWGVRSDSIISFAIQPFSRNEINGTLVFENLFAIFVTISKYNGYFLLKFPWRHTSPNYFCFQKAVLLIKELFISWKNN
jgi:hypothetical protein